MSTKRQRVLAKTNGNCGYCANPLPEKGWHMDHVEALFRGHDDIGGNDSESNLMASCARCNRWKKTFTVDEFRDEIEAQHERLYSNSAGYRLAHDFGVTTSSKDHGRSVVFYFETIEER